MTTNFVYHFQKSHTSRLFSRSHGKTFIRQRRDLTLNEHFMKMKMISIKKRRYIVKNRKKKFCLVCMCVKRKKRELAILYSYSLKWYISFLYTKFFCIKKKTHFVSFPLLSHTILSDNIKNKVLKGAFSSFHVSFMWKCN